MKVSIIIPTYNEEKTIGECLLSLSKQTFKDSEIIVIDDGSTDKTRNILGNFKLSNFHFLKQNHKGAGAARNLGAKEARGEIFVFVDADMSFDPNFIKNLIDPIIKNEAIGTFSKEERLKNKESIWAKCWNINRGLPLDLMVPKNAPNYQKVFRAILKSEFNKAHGFNEKAGYTDDWSLSEKLGKEALNAPQAIFYHQNPENLGEVFTQSRWMAKRKYKFGFLGQYIALLRVSFPVSLIVGFVKALKFRRPEFFVFKLISDLGSFVGILEYNLLGKTSK